MHVRDLTGTCNERSLYTDNVTRNSELNYGSLKIYILRISLNKMLSQLQYLNFSGDILKDSKRKVYELNNTPRPDGIVVAGLQIFLTF